MPIYNGFSYFEWPQQSAAGRLGMKVTTEMPRRRLLPIRGPGLTEMPFQTERR